MILVRPSQPKNDSISVTLSGMLILVRLLHPLNDTLVTLSGMSTFVRLMHPLNDTPVTLSEMSTFVRLLHPLNDTLPVTPSGMVTLVNSLQYQNALSSMLVTPFGMV